MDIEKKPTLYVMLYSHLDTQWRWDYKKTIKDYIWNTIKDNFTLLEKYDSYIFNFSGANRYRYFEEYYPEEYKKIKEYISNGRWFPCGSSVEENDVLVPSAESVIRQILYGNKYFRDHFGVESSEYMLPDCFGFPSSLPSILAHCGLKGFSTQKLTWGSAEGIPFNIGLWIGPDGNSVIAAFNPGDYVTQIRENLSQSEKWITRIEKLEKDTGLIKEYAYVGTGDWGGAPDEESVKMIHNSAHENGKINVRISKADTFFNALDENEISRLPKFIGELLLTNHSAGSLTSQAYVKRWNRKIEYMAYSAEVSAVIAEKICGLEYPRERISEAWRLMQSAQFHDILPGTCIPKAYEYSWNDQILSLNQFASVMTSSIQKIARCLDTATNDIPVVIYNPLSFDREDIVELKIESDPADTFSFSVFDPDNNETPSQVNQSGTNKFTILFCASVPSLGFSVYTIKKSNLTCKIKTDLSVDVNCIENKNLLIKINKDGDISRIFDKINGKEILSSPVRLAFMYEKPKEYPSWNMDWEDRKNDPAGFVDGEPKITITEFGPVRATIQIDRMSKGSKFIQEISLSYKSDLVTVKNYVDWFTPESSLKAVFPLSISNPTANYNNGLSIVSRKNNEPKKFEVPSQEWINITNEQDSYGVSILEDCKYGSDKPNNNTLRLTLLYTPGVRNDFKDQGSQDFGKHEFKYAVYPYRGAFSESGTPKLGQFFNQPLIPFIAKPHSGNLGKTFSFGKLNNRNVAISALKKAEYSDDIIVRLRELTGYGHENIKFSFYSPIINVKEVTGQEKSLSDIAVNNESINFSINPFGLKSFQIALNKSENHDSQKCRPVDLKMNTRAFSCNKEKVTSIFNSCNEFYPLEYIPESIRYGDIFFNLIRAEKDHMNALLCDGQEIEIHSENSSLYILAAATGEDKMSSFKINDTEFNLLIHSWKGFIGQWDNRIWDGDVDLINPDYFWGNIDFIGLKPGFTKNAEIPYFCTHTHDKDGNDIPYSYCYFFLYEIPLNQGLHKLTLPKGNEILIFAAALAGAVDLKPAAELYDNLQRKESDYSMFQICKKPAIECESFIVEPGETIKVEIVAREPESKIRFTLNGSEPDENSEIYREPLFISESITLKAASFKFDKIKSKTIEYPFYKARKVKSIKYLTPPSPKYSGKDERTLINTNRASLSHLDKNWIGYEAENLDVILDLGEVYDLNKITLGLLANNGSWIFLPKSIKIRLSKDGESYEDAGTLNMGIPLKDEGNKIHDISIELKKNNGRFIRVIAESIKQSPVWHTGAGGNAWLFCDQIIVE